MCVIKTPAHVHTVSQMDVFMLFILYLMYIIYRKRQNFRSNQMSYPNKSIHDILLV